MKKSTKNLLMIAAAIGGVMWWKKRQAQGAANAPAPTAGYFGDDATPSGAGTEEAPVVIEENYYLDDGADTGPWGWNPASYWSGGSGFRHGGRHHGGGGHHGGHHH